MIIIKPNFVYLSKKKVNLLLQLNVVFVDPNFRNARMILQYLMTLLDELLGKSKSNNLLPIRTKYLQLANEFRAYFLWKVKIIMDMFGNFLNNTHSS